MPDPIKEVLTRGIERIYPSREALEKELEKRKIVVYWGIDPTAPDLHLSHLENLLILKRFQDLGHKVVLLIGDATAQIGDPSERAAARKKLSKATVLKNAQDYKRKASKVIRFSGKKPARIVFNSQWWEKLTYLEAMSKIGYHFTSQQLLERDMFQKRIKAGNPPTVPELLYPMMQAYDSVMLRVDAELGGTDQIFSMLAGRELVKRFLRKEKFVIAKKLLADPRTGEILMSQSRGRYIAIDESPNEMFGKIMALPDEVLPDCFEVWTQIPMAGVKKILSNTKPMEAKKRLASEVIALLHTAPTKKTITKPLTYAVKKAAEAQKEFERVFKKREIPKTMSQIKIKEKQLPAIELLVKCKLAKSRSEARRLIEQGGVKIDELPITDYQLPITISDGIVIRVGKRRFVKVKKADR